MTQFKLQVYGIPGPKKTSFAQRIFEILTFQLCIARRIIKQLELW